MIFAGLAEARLRILLRETAALEQIEPRASDAVFDGDVLAPPRRVLEPDTPSV